MAKVGALRRTELEAGPAASHRRARRGIGRGGRIAVSLASLALILGTWTLVTTRGWVSDMFLPGPDLLWSGFVDLAQNGYKGRPLWLHVLMSLERVLAGFLTGAIVGTALGLAMGRSARLAALCDPFVEFLRPLPQLAYLVLLIVWFGIGETSKIILLFLTALPVAAVAARDGVRAVSTERLQAARSLGANEWQIFRHVILPSAMPEIVTGARLAAGIVYATLIASEIIAGTNGIGWMILDAGRFLRSDYVFVGIIIIAVLGLLLDRLLVQIERRLVHWAGKG
jgi:taurine transport system permease protein